ncbi:MAG: hypothetical protein ACLQLC_08225 [Candidatus Sulfotelmatobacter sp.]
MTTIRRLRAPALFVLTAALWFAIPGVAQTQGIHPPPPPPNSLPSPGTDELQQRQAKEVAKKANLARQAALQHDTEKLYQLATELKDSVAKSNENVLSVDVMRKAEEIEKLAHSVKEKMKGPS